MKQETVAAQLSWIKKSVIDRLPDGRFKSLAVTHLELVLFYAVASARREVDLFDALKDGTEPKPVLSGALKARTYDLLEEAIESGVRSGFHRAYKRTDFPTRDSLEEHLAREVMSAIFERFDTE